MSGKRIRITMSYMEGAGSDLEHALALTGISPSDNTLVNKLLVLGALAWARGAGLADSRDGVAVVFPGDAGQKAFAGDASSTTPYKTRTTHPVPARSTPMAGDKPVTLIKVASPQESKPASEQGSTVNDGGTTEKFDPVLVNMDDRIPRLDF